MIEYKKQLLDSLSSSEKENLISFIKGDADATVPLDVMFEHECTKHLGAEVIFAYEDGNLVGAHMWRTASGSGYVNSHPELQKAIVNAGYLQSELVVTLMTAVKESHRGKGIGTEMYDLVTQSAASKGFKAMMPVVPSYSKLAVSFLTGQGEKNLATKLLGYTDFMGYEMRVMPFA